MSEARSLAKDDDGPKGMFAGWNAEYVTREVLLGITICFAQIPESVAFAFMANIKPPIALHAAWVMGLICSVFGGRPGMVNGATGAFAAIIGTFIPNAGTGNNGEGVELLFPSVMVAGVLMLLVSVTNLSRFITLLPSPVMIGFCNGLAIVIGLAQLHPFKDPVTHGWKEGPELVWMLVICFTSMSVMEFLPKVPLKILKVVPSSLLAIVAAVVLEFLVVRLMFGHRTDTIRDVSEFTLDTAFPIPFFVKTDAVSYDLSPIMTAEGLQKILIQGVLLCIVGSIESLMTSEVVESFVKTPSDGNRTVLAMGVGNIISGFFGGMGGNAMIGLSTVNCLNGGTGRLGPTVAALGIMACVMGAYPLLNYIPVAALAGIMLVVVLHTFKWFSLKMLVAAFMPQTVRDRFGILNKVPRMEVFTIFAVTILANYPAGTNIAYAVGVGVALCSMSYAWTSGQQFTVETSLSPGGNVKYYDVSGPLFFTSSNMFHKLMNPDNDPDYVEVRFADPSAVMDFSAMECLHKIAADYKDQGKEVVFKSLGVHSQRLIEKCTSLVKEISYYSAAGNIEVDEEPFDDLPYPHRAISENSSKSRHSHHSRPISVEEITIQTAVKEAPDEGLTLRHSVQSDGNGAVTYGKVISHQLMTSEEDAKDYNSARPSEKSNKPVDIEKANGREQQAAKKKQQGLGCLLCVYYRRLFF